MIKQVELKGKYNMIVFPKAVASVYGFSIIRQKRAGYPLIFQFGDMHIQTPSPFPKFDIMNRPESWDEGKFSNHVRENY